MANLIRLTVIESNKLTSTGSYSFNTALIKKVYTFGTGSLIYYVDGSDKQSKIIKIKVSESASTVNAALGGSLDFAIAVNSILSNGTVRSETIKTSDIIYGKVDPSDLNKTIFKISDIDQNIVALNLNDTLSSIETAANNYSFSGGGGTTWGSITGTLSSQTDLNTQLGLKSVKTTTDPLSPLINQTFSGQFNLSTNYEVYYNQYTTNTTVTPTISSSPLVGACARVVFDAGASAALTTSNLGTLRAGSDTFTVSKLNEILVFNLPEGLEYSIKVLN